MSVNGDAADRSPDGVARSAASPFTAADDVSTSRDIATRPDAEATEVAEAEAYWADGHASRADLDAEPRLHEPNHRHGNDLDHLAARLVNGGLTGRPVADAVDLPASSGPSARS